MADIAVTLPMNGMANSINVAAAAAIVLYGLSSSLGTQSNLPIVASQRRQNLTCLCVRF